MILFLILCVLIFIAMILWNGFKETVNQLVDIEEALKKVGRTTRRPR
jgi:4-hydroxybenzoate polyprenyltransferase